MTFSAKESPPKTLTTASLCSGFMPGQPSFSRRLTPPAQRFPCSRDCLFSTHRRACSGCGQSPGADTCVRSSTRLRGARTTESWASRPSEMRLSIAPSLSCRRFRSLGRPPHRLGPGHVVREANRNRCTRSAPNDTPRAGPIGSFMFVTLPVRGRTGPGSRCSSSCPIENHGRRQKRVNGACLNGSTPGLVEPHGRDRCRSNMVPSLQQFFPRTLFGRRPREADNPIEGGVVARLRQEVGDERVRQARVLKHENPRNIPELAIAHRSPHVVASSVVHVQSCAAPSSCCCGRGRACSQASPRAVTTASPTQARLARISRVESSLFV